MVTNGIDEGSNTNQWGFGEERKDCEKRMNAQKREIYTGVKPIYKAFKRIRSQPLTSPLWYGLYHYLLVSLHHVLRQARGVNGREFTHSTFKGLQAQMYIYVML